MAKTCKSCKLVSETGEGYRPVSLIDPASEYCPACFPKKRASGAWAWVLLYPALFGFWIFEAHRKPHELAPWFFLNLLLTIVLQAVVVLPHELGHALVARLVGFKVHRIVAGFGPIFLKVGVFEIRIHPWSGYTQASTPRIEGYRGRKWLLIAGGPLVNLILLAIASPWLPWPNPMKGFLHDWQPITDFALANALVLAWNLLPRRSSTLDLDSDGRLLLKTPGLTPAEIRTQVSYHYLIEGLECLAKRQDEAAIRWNEEGLREFPETILLRNNAGVARLRLGHLEQARSDFLAVAASKEVAADIKALAQNNVAVANLILERSDLLEESDRMSADAVQRLPWHPTLRTTRGSVLVAAGKVDEGLEMVRGSFSRLESPEHRAVAACAIAMGLRTKGDVNEGLKHLEMAEKLDPQCKMLPQTRRAYGRAPS